jgi:microcystin-dependent protein
MKPEPLQPNTSPSTTFTRRTFLRSSALVLSAVGSQLVFNSVARAGGTEPFIGEIMIVSFGFAPRGWVACNGQLLPINQNAALFSLLGTTFGGDGRVNFALPDLRGRVPIHVGNGYTLGERGGEQAHTLTVSEMPAHTHALRASPTRANSTNPAGSVLAAANNAYRRPDAATTLNPATLATGGASQAHLNMQPFLALNFVIALQGIFPS